LTWTEVDMDFNIGQDTIKIGLTTV